MSAAARDAVTTAAARVDEALARLDRQIAELRDERAPRAMRSERITRPHPSADVLLVDDEPFALDLGAYLRAHLSGATVRVVQRAEDALSLAGCGTWRVAVLDLHLGHPRVTGLDVLAALPASTRVVLVTGVAPSELPHVAARAHVDAHLLKPFAPAELARVVAELLAKTADAAEAL